MIIDRHNYEEYFILYMDNELSSDERRMVEAFVQQHPDLEEELNLLLQYKLVPDTHIVFEGKEELIKTGDCSTITFSNYDEWLVLYMDNELNPNQKTEVEQFISANPLLKDELALLQRTQLEPEEIIFADKASLYRREEKLRPMPVRWQRIAAAVLLLLGIGVTTAIIVNKKSPGGEIVKGTTPVKKANSEIPVVIPNKSNSPVYQNVVADNDIKITSPVIKEGKNNIAIAKEKKDPLKNPAPVQVTKQPIKDEPVVAVVDNNKKTNELPRPLNNPNINKNDITNNAVASNTPSKETGKENALTNPVVTTNTPLSSDIVNASYKNSDDIALDQPDGKKNKNRGFFRKIARTFEKRTDIDPTDDNKLLVAGLAIKLK